MVKSGPRSRSTAERFWPRVNIPVLSQGELLSDDSWEWQGGVAKRTGYGRVWHKGETRLAHRVSYELAYGAIPDDTLVCHHCDNRPCVRPDHLFIGSHQDNHDDRGAKGDTARGERIAQHVLTEPQVVEIKRRLNSGESQTAIAEDFPVGRVTVGCIARGTRWAHVTSTGSI